MITVLDAWRDRGFGVPVTPETLTRAGVPDSLARRTFQSLSHLDLIDADGQPTEQFQDFRATRGDDEYRTRLQEWLRAVYADVLQYTDPTTDPYDRVTEAFRTYEPAGQRRAMASLLIGLWKHAGLPVPAATPNGERPRRATQRTRRVTPKTTKTTEHIGQPLPQSASGLTLDGLPPGLLGLLHQIPRGGAGWTKETRDQFLAAFTAVLDFTVPVRPAGLEDLTDRDTSDADEEHEQ